MTSRLEQLIEEIVAEAGAKVFDLDLPRGPNGVLRVYVCNPDGSVEGVGLEHCTRVNRRLSDSLELDELIEGSYVLEVTTPGINRRLRKADHFAHAVGERVKFRLNRSLVSEPVGSADDLNSGGLGANERKEHSEENLTESDDCGEDHSAGKLVVIGVIKSFRDQYLEVEVEHKISRKKKQAKGSQLSARRSSQSEAGQLYQIPLAAIYDAQVDFVFE